VRTIEEIKEIIRSHDLELKQRFKVKRIAVFGSYARGEQTEDSDVDLLVEFSEPVGFLFIHLADYLEEILGMRVDLITPSAIKPNRERLIMDELSYV